MAPVTVSTLPDEPQPPALAPTGAVHVSLSAVTKLPHPIQDQRVADRNRRTICEVRGYCGPFINQAF
jgi:hypothetical protein